MHGIARVFSFFRSMGRSIKAGNSEQRVEQTDDKSHEGARRRRYIAAGCTAEVGEGKGFSKVDRGCGHQEHDDQGHRHHKDQVTGEVGHDGCQANTEMVEQGLRRSNCRDGHDLRRSRPRTDIHTHHCAKPQVFGDGVQKHVDRRHHKQQAQQIDIGRGPTPEAPAQNRRPVVKATSRWVSRGNLPQARRHYQRKNTTH